MQRSTTALLTAAALSASALFASGGDTGTANDPLIPELWAHESLAILEENMIMGNLVYRDYENTLQNYGDVVNAHRPNSFVGKRKTDADDVTVQGATATNVPVPLNQHVHVSFTIKDGERSKAFVDLVALYLRPALIAQASFIDKILTGQTIRFIANNAGALGQGSATTIDDYTLSAREKLSLNKAPMVGRNIMMGTRTDTLFQKTPLFVQANTRGDGGNALTTANLGTLHGFALYSSQNQPYVSTGNSLIAGFLVNNSNNYTAGSTTILVDTGTSQLVVGTYVVFAGDYVPQRVTDLVNSGTNPTSSVTVSPGLAQAVVNNAAVTVYAPGQVNQASASIPSGAGASGYDVGYAKEITVDGFTVAPRVGQPVNFGGDEVYTIIDVNGTTGITLDRPLEAAILNDAYVCIGPAGSYNLAFTREALALVCRPLAAPPEGMGARSAVVNYNGFAVRVTMTYSGTGQGILCTIDALCGVAILDVNLGCVLLA